MNKLLVSMISFHTAFLSSATLLFCSGVLRVAASPFADGALTHTIAKRNSRNTLLGGGSSTLQLQTRRHLAAVDSGSRNMRALFGSDDDACEVLNFSLDPSIDPASYYTVTKNETYFDFTALQELSNVACEFYYGGILYSVSGFEACGNTDDADFGKNYTHKNLPYCATLGCTIDESTVNNYEHFNFCEDPELATREYQVSTVVTSVLSGECKAQLDMFSPAVHYLTPLSDVLDISDYDISAAGDESEYDFEPTLANFTVACEAEGGYVYKFSGSQFSNVYFYGVGTTTSLNRPICLGTSCDATKFFDLLNFTSNSFPAAQNFTFLGFEAVSDVPTPKPMLPPDSDDSTASSSALLLVSIFAATLSIFVSSAMMF